MNTNPNHISNGNHFVDEECQPILVLDTARTRGQGHDCNGCTTATTRTTTRTMSKQEEEEEEEEQEQIVSYGSIIQKKTEEKQQQKEEEEEKEKEESPPLFVYIVAACAACNSCNLGFDIGVNSPAAILVQEYFDLSTNQLELFMGSINLFALMGTMISNELIERLGMLLSFVVSSMVFLVGISIMTFSTMFETLMIGRILVGFGVGLGFTITPLYLAEISPKSHRGLFVSWSEIGCNIGILLGFTTGLIFHHYPSSIAWRYMFATGAILPLLVAIFAGTSTWVRPSSSSSSSLSTNKKTIPPATTTTTITSCMVESPRWLVKQGLDQEAMDVLKKLHPPNYNIKQVLMDIKIDMELEKHLKDHQHQHQHQQDTITTTTTTTTTKTTSTTTTSRTDTWSYLFIDPPKAIQRMLWTGLLIAIIHQGTGIDAIQYYLVFILQASNITERLEQAKYLISLGTLKLLCLFVSSSVVDTYGRRPLLFTSLTGMCIALCIIACNFFFFFSQPNDFNNNSTHDYDDDDDHNNTHASSMSFSTMMVLFGLGLYLTSFSIGLGPLGWIIPPEIFSTTIRSKAVTCTTFTNRIMATIVTSSMLTLAHMLTWGGYFCLLACISFLGCTLSFWYLPETKGKQLEEMTLYFEQQVLQ